MIYQGKKRYPVREVVLHTSATPGTWYRGKTADQMRDEIRRWHVDGRGWRDIGYHRVIAPDGEIAIGRSLWEIGAHVMGRNRGTIGICLVPVRTHNGIGQFSDYFTPDQEKALKAYLRELAALTKIERVSGHNEFAAKECPGFRVRTGDWIE